MKGFSFEGFIEKLKWIYFIELMSSEVYSFLYLCQTEYTLQSTFFTFMVSFKLCCLEIAPQTLQWNDKEGDCTYKEYWQVLSFFWKTK